MYEKDLITITVLDYLQRNCSPWNRATARFYCRSWQRADSKWIGYLYTQTVLSKTAKTLTSTLKTTYRTNEQSKKREYNRHYLWIDHGTFTQLVFSTFGGYGYETNKFIKILNKLKLTAYKRNESIRWPVILSNTGRKKSSTKLLKRNWDFTPRSRKTSKETLT